MEQSFATGSRMSVHEGRVAPRQSDCDGNSSAFIDSPSRFHRYWWDWQLAASEGGTCTRGLRIRRPIAWTITALSSSPRVRLRSITNTQGSPSHRLTLLTSLNASLTWTSSSFGWHPQIREHFHLGLSHVLIRSKLQLARKPGDTLS